MAWLLLVEVTSVCMWVTENMNRNLRGSPQSLSMNTSMLTVDLKLNCTPDEHVHTLGYRNQSTSAMKSIDSAQSKSKLTLPLISIGCYLKVIIIQHPIQYQFSVQLLATRITIQDYPMTIIPRLANTPRHSKLDAPSVHPLGQRR